jgi:uncharacterized protein YdeI (YjbR/CyaY-like superfamily)
VIACKNSDELRAMKTFEAKTLPQWRKWLAGHHDSEQEIWLVFHKKHTGRTSIAYSDALDEALCFGWIDSLIKRLDGDRYARKFTPRKPDSVWSEINRKRYAALEAEGRLKPPGLERAPTSRSYQALNRSFSKVPAYMEDALRKRPKALRYFESLAPSHRKMYIAWIDTAKRDETKKKRLAEALRLLSEGKKLGLK